MWKHWIVASWLVCSPAAALDFASERAQLCGAIADALQMDYVFPEVADKLADQLWAQARSGAYAQLTNGDALAQQLTAELRAVSRDDHLGVQFYAQGAPDEPPRGTPSEDELQRMRADNFGFHKVERLPGA